MESVVALLNGNRTDGTVETCFEILWCWTSLCQNVRGGERLLSMDRLGNLCYPGPNDDLNKICSLRESTYLLP